MRPYGFKSIYTPGVGYSDTAIKWVVVGSLAVAAAIAVLTATAFIYGS